MRWQEIVKTRMAVGRRIIETGDLAAELTALQRERDALLARWAEIKKADPEPDDPISHESSAWWNDPERGGLWPKRIYPLNQRIEAVEAAITRQRRTALLQTKRGSDAGFDTSEVLYHGTNAEFEVFDRTKARTAAHIYTSPDIETARSYGDNVYALYGRQQPQADLSVENTDYHLLSRLHRAGAYRKHYGLSLADFTDVVTGGDLYGSSGQLQDEVVSTCLGMKYRSVRISDRAPGGSFSDSVIFGDPANLQIIEQVA